MDSETYNVLKRFSSYRFVDRSDLKRLRPHARPFVAEKIDHMLDRINPSADLEHFHLDKYRTTFRDQSPHVIKDEVATTFLLFVSAQLSEIKIVRTFHLPGAWDLETQWTYLLKWLTFSVLTLLYNVRWKTEYFPYLDEMMADLMLGDSRALRRLAEQIGIEFGRDTFEAEEWYTKLLYHNSSVYGSYYWRLIHWMAEAAMLRTENPDVALARSLWKEYTIASMHRTLLCIYCKQHYLEILERYRDRFENDTDYPRLWYDVHNEVNKKTNKTVYPEEEFEKDREFMRRALY
ncbi:small rna 2 -o-methyltransferase-like protein [Lasius niger]|uniref:Sulfhydryl oxidase n=1 Tax=Lasius niger TaxID=67767 RepID=A0A0J7K083_LASNI|nr:small rna 2 -o-methyltransferase-like protein [Lasius niger]